MIELADARRDDVFMSPLALDVYLQKFSWRNLVPKEVDGKERWVRGEPTEVWPDTCYRVCLHVLGALGIEPDDERFQRIHELMVLRKFIPGGRYLAMAGREVHPVNNCFLYRCGDSREGWSDLHRKAELALTLGGGVGVVYSDVREEWAPIQKTGGTASGPLGPMKVTNEIGREIVQGGTRRSAIWAGLHWSHPDIFKFIRIKDWPQAVRDLKDPEKGGDPDFPAPMDKTNVSVILDSEFFFAYQNPGHPKHNLAHDVYLKTVARMVKTGEPGFSIDAGENEGENLRNACTEITSYDDSDVCNLGSINLARVEDIREFEEVVDLATLFLIAGTVYSDLPHEEVGEVRAKNRRLGLGLMGIHEWLLQRGYSYEPNIELEEWLVSYTKSDLYAAAWADVYGLSHPVKTRAIAPNGSIGILAETTTGIEPIFCVAYKRTFIEGRDVRQSRVMIDPTAKRLIDEGHDPDEIDDAYTISLDARLKFQEWVQRFVDHGISSTINIPAPITDPLEVKLFADSLMGYLPGLRGVTVYPDGARGGQPITPVDYEYAIKRGDALVNESEERCAAGTACGI